MDLKVIHSFLIVVFFIVNPIQTKVQEICGIKDSSGHGVKVDIETMEDEDGVWVTSFTAVKNSSVLSKKLNLEVGHEIFDCGGRQIVRVSGIVKDSLNRNFSEKKELLTPSFSRNFSGKGLYFDETCSPNAYIDNHGLTLKKWSSFKTASALTNRTLEDNELLEVVLNNRSDNNNHAMAIGVTVHNSSSLSSEDHINGLGKGTWMLYYAMVFHNSNALVSHYMESDLNVQVGGRVGVMRKSSGDLHFYLDGVDKGRAASNVPKEVYGAVELWGAALEATIVN